MGNNLCVDRGTPLEFPEAEFNALGFRRLSGPVQQVLD